MCPAAIRLSMLCIKPTLFRIQLYKDADVVVAISKKTQHGLIALMLYLMSIYVAIKALTCNFIALVISLDSIYKDYVCSCPYGIGLLFLYNECDLLRRMETEAVDLATSVRLILFNACANSS